MVGFCSCKTDIHYIHVDNIRTVQTQLGHADVKTTEIVSPGVLPTATLVRPEHRIHMY